MSQIKVGCCGMRGGLAAYAGVFPVVEVQQTFYQSPTLETVRRWRERFEGIRLCSPPW